MQVLDFFFLEIQQAFFGKQEWKYMWFEHSLTSAEMDGFGFSCAIQPQCLQALKNYSSQRKWHEHYTKDSIINCK